MKIGNNDTTIKIGQNNVDAVYLGSNKIYPKGEPSDVYDPDSEWYLATNPIAVVQRDVAYGNGLWVTISSTTGSNRVQVSEDNGATWEAYPSGSYDGSYGAIQWYSIAFGAGRFVAVAYGALALGSNRAMISEDGVNWTVINVGINISFNRVIYSETYSSFFAVANLGTTYKIMRSTNGEEWEGIELPSSISGSTFSGITEGANGRLVALMSTTTNNNYVAYSDNGVDWNPVVGGASAWNAITYGNGLYVAVATTGTNRIMYSSDAETWTSISAPSSLSWTSIAYGGGYFISVATNGTAMLSNNGTTWTTKVTGAGTSTYNIKYDNKKFQTAGTRMASSPPPV